MLPRKPAWNRSLKKSGIMESGDKNGPPGRIAFSICVN